MDPRRHLVVHLRQGRDNNPETRVSKWCNVDVQMESQNKASMAEKQRVCVNTKAASVCRIQDVK